MLENWPTSVVSSGSTLYLRHEVSNATPSQPVAFFVDFAVGGTYPALSVPGFGGEIFGSGLLLSVGASIADTNGFAVHTVQLPPTAISSPLAIVWQCFDVGEWTFGLPAAMQIQ